MFEAVAMGTRELWFGTSQWGGRVETVLVHHDIWPGFSWRVEWGPPPDRKREVFRGDEEQQARAFLAEKQAELGSNWEMVRRS